MQRLATMLAFPIVAESFGGCAAQRRYELIAAQAAAQQTTTCESSTAVAAVRLEEDWAFRVDTCDGPTYWHCFEQLRPPKKGMGVWPQKNRYPDRVYGSGECCARVASEDAANSSDLPELDDNWPLVCRDAP